MVNLSDKPIRETTLISLNHTMVINIPNNIGKCCQNIIYTVRMNTKYLLKISCDGSFPTMRVMLEIA